MTRGGDAKGNASTADRWILSFGRLVYWILGLAATVAAVFAAGRISDRIQIAALVHRSDIELDRYGDTLNSELRRFDYLPTVLDLNAEVGAVLQEPLNVESIDRVNHYLERVNRAAGAAALYVINRDGKVLTSSNWNDPVSFVGIDLSYRPYFQAAMRGEAGRFFGIGTTSGAPGYYFARPLPAQGPILGVGVVKLDLDRLQTTPGPRTSETMVVDENGVIMLASRPAWRFRTIIPLPARTRDELRLTRQYERVALEPLDFPVQQRPTVTSAIVAMPADDSHESSDDMLMQERALKGSGWKILVFTDLDEVNALSNASRIIVGLSAFSLFLLASYWIQLRKTAVVERIAKIMLTKANNQLERDVAVRTRDLSDANDRLRETQDELIHSARLAVLGQLAVGITHEMSQPLAAIRTLSDNARTLIARADFGEAGGNLAMISDLIQRMAHMNGQLKLFARKAPRSFEPRVIAPCIDCALAILAEKSARVRAIIAVDAAATDMKVLCDGARLEQVFVNLIGNALDAVAGRPDAAVAIRLAEVGGQVSIDVDDNGAGLSEGAAEHLFEPFFSTKPKGEGLGLGLTISEGIIRDFGGTLRASNRPGGGARFSIQLPSLTQSDAAAHV